MWTFLISCYVLMGMTTILLLITGYAGFTHNFIWGVNHPRIATVTIIILSLTETLVMYFFIATSKAYKPLIAHLDQAQVFQIKMAKIKGPIYKHVSLTVLLFGIIFILGGAADNNFSIGWLHGQLFLVGILYYFYALKIKNTAFQDQVALLNDMDKSL
ncbi:MAG: hypothetical protein ISR83_00845 [Candidatus Marinimicrobia bacterium]|nr:hypothetical protein [Candidatus Neomarinimicrobiota bacterium]